ncbi:hypothetical protein [Paracoccus onubensis]|uniref:hypothetical protein n=1 Tax=Paracoccus onubensis TaxID=1675788 RepID=UPI0011C39729|nr:hypothetical protein [Paracoccus onubensis]
MDLDLKFVALHVGREFDLLDKRAQHIGIAAAIMSVPTISDEAFFGRIHRRFHHPHGDVDIICCQPTSGLLAFDQGRFHIGGHDAHALIRPDADIAGLYLDAV